MIDAIKDFLFGDDRIYLALAVFGSIIFIIQMILSFFLGDVEADVDGDGEVAFGEHADSGFGDFRFFSLRSIIAFIMFFGWGGVIAWKHGIRGFACFSISMASGLVMMLITALMLWVILKLQHSGNMKPEDFIGATGTVYLRIPAGRIKIGKVTASVKGTSQEIIAIADEEIERGTSVEILEKIDGRRFLVKQI
jgi:hypothetical protein